MRTLKEYIDSLNKLLEEYPGAAGFKVVISGDDEGNSFDYIWSDPDVGFMNDDGDFYFAEGLKDLGFELSDINAVCVN